MLEVAVAAQSICIHGEAGGLIVYSHMPGNGSEKRVPCHWPTCCQVMIADDGISCYTEGMMYRWHSGGTCDLPLNCQMR